MTPTMHLLLLPLLLGIAAGKGLENRKGPIENTILNIPEEAPQHYPVYQFQASKPGVNLFRVSGEGNGAIMIADDGWLYLGKALDWSQDTNYIVMVEALVDDEVVEGPAYITINVMDSNNHAPTFNQTDYAAVVRERSPAGVPFTRVFATDEDDPESPNALLAYSLVSQIPNRLNTLFFQIHPVTGEISTTEEGEQLIKAREGILYGSEEDRSADTLKRMFNEYCSPKQEIPFEHNPFYKCVERAELRSQHVDPLGDPDFTLIVRVRDLGGLAENALSGNTKVNVVVQQNLWVSPGPITVREHHAASYPYVITTVRSNEPNAFYRLAQKERQLRFPFSITEKGEILLTEELDREEKDMYILVVFAEDGHGMEVDPPLEIQVVVEDINDNSPECVNKESEFEVQEDEPRGSLVGQLLVHDADEPGTVNSLLSYTVVSQQPSTGAFSIDDVTGQIQARQSLRRVDATEYRLVVKVSDPEHSTQCKVLIKVIDVNNELPLFEKTDYGSHSLAEDTELGHTVLTVRAADADEPGSGSSRIEFHIAAGNDNDVFDMVTDGSGEGRLVVVKPLDFESAPSYTLRIDARNPEPLMKGLKYGENSSTVVSVSVTDVDEVPEFSLHILAVVAPENTSVGTVLLTVEAKDPEGQEINFKMEGDTNGWLEIDSATGEIKTKAELDREKLEAFDVTITAFEKANPEKSSERVVSVRLLDVNDNVPKLTEFQAFICVKKNLEPVFIKAHDSDSAPFSQPFTFALAHVKKSPNWDLHSVDDTSAKLVLKKIPTEDKTFLIPINIQDNAGMGVTHKFEVRVCNCTELGYCYTKPGTQARYGMGATIGILAGTILFCVLVLAITLNQINKSNRKKALRGDEAEVMMY